MRLVAVLLVALAAALGLPRSVAGQGALGELLSVQWRRCDQGPTRATRAYTPNFWPLSQCLDLGIMASRGLREVEEFCPHNTSALRTIPNCTALASEAFGMFWCHSVAGGAVNFSVPEAVTDALEDPGTCSDGAGGVAALHRSSAVVAVPPSQTRARLRCEDGVVRFVPCHEGDVYSPLLAFEPFPEGTCSRGLVFECSYCQPYIEESSVAQPYFFLVFPALKLMAVVLLKLFLLDSLAQRIRLRAERFQRERPPPLEDVDEGFVRFFVDEVLLQGQLRIRLRLTMRNRDARWAIKRALASYKEGGGGRGLTEEERAPLVAPRALSVQRALLSRETAVANYVFVMSQVLEGVRLSEAQEGALAAEEEWFWREVALGGERVFRGMLDDLNVHFHNVWPLHCLPQAHAYGERSADAEGPSTAVELVLREVGHEDDRKAAELVIHAERSMLAEELLETIRYLVRATNTRFDFDNALSLYSCNTGRALWIDAAATVQDLLPMAQGGEQAHHADDAHHRPGAVVVTLRYAVGKEAQRESVFPATFKPIARRVAALRHQFLASAAFEYARFDPDALRHETRVAISKIMDRRRQSVLCEQLLLMVGGEVVFDYEVLDPFRFRDSIPQLRAKKERESRERAARLQQRLQPKVESPATATTPSRGSPPTQGRGGGCGVAATARDDLKSPDQLATKSAKDDTIPCLEWLFAVHSGDSDVDGTASFREPISPGVAARGGGGLEVRRQGVELVVPVARPVTPIFRVDPNSQLLHLRTDVQPQQSKVIELYNRAFRLLTQFSDHRGMRKEGLMRAFKRDREQLCMTLSQLYSAVEGRLVAARNEANMVDVGAIAEQFRARVDSYCRIVPVVTKEEQVFKTIYSVNIYILAAQTFYALLFFAFCVVDGLRRAPEDASSWTIYELIYFRFLNSGTPASLLGSSLANIVSGGEARANSYFFTIVDYSLLVIAMALLAPPLLTHLIPGFVLYCWIFFAAFVGIRLPTSAMEFVYHRFQTKWTNADRYTPAEIRRNHQTLKVIVTVLLVWFQFCMIVLMTGVFQSTFNWAHLFYNRHVYALDYGGVLEFEWRSRSVACYFSTAFAGVANAMQLFSSFIG